jgi:Uma2 family endonuclease
MEATIIQLSADLDELEEGDVLRIPATWEEYYDLAEQTEYNIQFLNDEIIIMSQATETHEQLVIRLGALFLAYFDELDNHRVLGSNVKIVIPERRGDFNADLSVVRGPSVYGKTPTGRDSKVRIQNPNIVVEVLSKGTRAFDVNEKFDAYTTIPSLQHVLFVDQERVYARIFSRVGQTEEWLTVSFHALTDTVRLGDFGLRLADVYRKIEFAAAGKPV